jgi:NAD(P)-dependent dehydrogenase (short-subunit alcohol dehydrogenase family)
MTVANGHGNRSLEAKVALVTGAARGIGRAIALELASRGAAVAVNYRSSTEHATSLAERIREMGRDCLLVPGDVLNREDACHVVETVLDAWKRLDILVNNAGVTRGKSVRKMADDEWADEVSVNLNGTYNCTSAALPSMMAQKFGRIINIRWYVGHSSELGEANYVSRTGGIIAFTKSIALEMAKYNITVNAIAPGFTSTEMFSKIPEKILDQIRTKIPLHRFARPDEVAKAAAFLAADGDYITGQQLNISGGLYM